MAGRTHRAPGRRAMEVLSCLLLLLGIASGAAAAPFNAFGPRLYTRAAGAPAAVTADFAVRNPAARYSLVIENNGVSSAVITLNGVTVFGPDDFRQHTAAMSKDVSVAANNILGVELRGQPDESLLVRVVGFDEDLPAIAATAAPPPNAAGWNNGDVTVSFTCDDATSGIATCPATVVASLEGADQAVSGTAVDVAGNTAAASVTLDIDRTAPGITILSPQEGATVSGLQVTVTGQVLDTLSGVASVSCNGAQTPVANGQFTCTVTVVAGENVLSFAATDAAGNGGSASRTIHVSAAPLVRITEPANFAFVNISPITVRGTVSDRSATVTVGGITTPLANGTFSVQVPLVEGNNNVTAVALSATGEAGVGSVQVTLDTTPPHVAIYAPADGAVTTDDRLTISGLVNDIVVGTVNDQQAQVTVNGVAASVANRSFVAANVPLSPGENLIRATARDRVGNAYTAQITVRRDTAAGARIETVSGDAQTAAIGALLPQPLAVRLVNGLGQPVANQHVVFRVVQSDGTLDDVAGSNAGRNSVAATTDAAGVARARYRLGTRAGAGNNRVEATATGFAGTASFVVSATAGAASAVNFDSGAGQTGAVGRPLTFPFIVVVTDSGNNRLGNVPITFRVREGGGNLGGSDSLTTVSDSDGRAAAILTLGPNPGFDNNAVEATAGDGTDPVIFRASAKTAGNAVDTRIRGVVLDNSNHPIVGVTVRVYQAYQASNSNIPIPIGTPAVTDAEGQFVIHPAPVGAYKLVADGTTVQQPSVAYPSVEYDIVTVAGQDNTVGSPIYLPKLDVVNRVCVTGSTGGTLTLPGVPGFSFTIAPGSAVFPGGSRTGCITVTPVHGDKVPMVPGFGQQPRIVVTIQPAGTHFNPPAQISFPNVDGLAPRQVTEMYSYDHDLSAFVAIGTATVSADGAVLRSDPGVGVLKAGWHCGGNPAPAGSVENTSVDVDRDSVIIPAGGYVDVTATGSPTPPGTPGYRWSSADTAIATVAYAPGNASQTHSNKGRIDGIDGGATKVKVVYRCKSGQPDEREVEVKVVSADAIEATVPSTRNVATGAKPPDGTFTSTGRDTNFDETNMMTVLMNAGEITLKAKNPKPDADDLLWQIDRNPADTVDSGTPDLGTSGAEVTLTPSKPGHFRVILYVDTDGDDEWDAGEELRTIKVAIVRATVQPGHFISTEGQFSGRSDLEEERIETHGAMLIRADVLLEGGGATRRIGLDRVTLGNVGNLREDDSFAVRYPVPTPTPPPPGDVVGFQHEVQNGDIPMLDTTNVPTRDTEPTGGSQALRASSREDSRGTGPGGNGELRRVTGGDTPAFRWDRRHPTTRNRWGTTTGSHRFREGIVGFSRQFIHNYVAVASARWDVEISGSVSDTGRWTDTGSRISVQGVPGSPAANAPLTTFPMQPADAASIQVRGFSFPRNVSRVSTPVR
ncbi:MAG TPA: Ig-like domain-containing protein [Thermoanaerobaculia bacterium]